MGQGRQPCSMKSSKEAVKEVAKIIINVVIIWHRSGQQGVGGSAGRQQLEAAYPSWACTPATQSYSVLATKKPPLEL